MDHSQQDKILLHQPQKEIVQIASLIAEIQTTVAGLDYLVGKRSLAVEPCLALGEKGAASR